MTKEAVVETRTRCRVYARGVDSVVELPAGATVRDALVGAGIDPAGMGREGGVARTRGSVEPLSLDEPAPAELLWTEELQGG